jgi:FkbM family methyltransferase
MQGLFLRFVYNTTKKPFFKRFGTLIYYLVMFQTTKAQKRKIKRAVRERNINYLVKATLFHLRVSHYFTLKRLGYRMRVFYTPFSFWLWTEGRERSDEFFYKRFLRTGDTVVDAGANIGVCTLLSASIVGKAGSVYSFEPHPRTFRQLKKNVSLGNFKNITLYNKGASNIQETVSFTNEYVSDINHIHPEGKKRVTLVRLDDELTSVKKVTLLKIDVEGYELLTLTGARELLKNTEAVYFEKCDSSYMRYGYTFKDIFDFFEDAGFCVYKIGQDLELSKITRNYASLSGYENLLAVRETHISSVKKRLIKS